jgi:FG-GAP-like repeat
MDRFALRLLGAEVKRQTVSNRGTQTMSPTIKFPKKRCLHLAVLAAVASVGVTTDTLAQRQQAGYINQAASVSQGVDAIFRSGFGSSVLSLSLANPQPNLFDVYNGAFASGDIDGDGDIDLFMSGISPQREAKLYLNDGTGNFSEITSPFPGASNSQAFFKDFDGDGDLDMFYSGSGLSNRFFTNVYLNNGAGGFTQIANPALPKFAEGAAIADVDNDGDQDIVVSTQTSTGAFVADVFKNDGNAIFSPQGSSAFTAARGVVEFIDFDNDGDPDVIISGREANNALSTKLYRNDGSGAFALNTESTFAALSGQDIDVADTDNDGDLDVLLSGSIRNLLYANNRTGIFTELATSLEQTADGENQFADLDSDGDQDLLITGRVNGGSIFTAVYENKGSNVFAQAVAFPVGFLSTCSIEDFTGDGFKDVVIQAFEGGTNVYWNTSTNTN